MTCIQDLAGQYRHRMVSCLRQRHTDVPTETSLDGGVRHFIYPTSCVGSFHSAFLRYPCSPVFIVYGAFMSELLRERQNPLR